MPSVANKPIMLSVYYAECHLRWVSQIRPLCWLSIIQSVANKPIVLAEGLSSRVSLYWMSWRQYLRVRTGIGVTALSIMTFSITILNITIILDTLGITTVSSCMGNVIILCVVVLVWVSHFYSYADCRYAACRAAPRTERPYPKYFMMLKTLAKDKRTSLFVHSMGDKDKNFIK